MITCLDPDNYSLTPDEHPLGPQWFVLGSQLSPAWIPFLAPTWTLMITVWTIWTLRNTAWTPIYTLLDPDEHSLGSQWSLLIITDDFYLDADNQHMDPNDHHRPRWSLLITLLDSSDHRLDPSDHWWSPLKPQWSPQTPVITDDNPFGLQWLPLGPQLITDDRCLDPNSSLIVFHFGYVGYV